MNEISQHNKVSIIVPLYNQERLFEKCIRSICQQTYKNIEVVVIDDGSTDKSPQIADTWASNDSRIKVIHKKNEGASKARFDGYRMTTGEFLIPVDSDDYLPQNAIELLVGYMTSKNVDVVLGSMTQVIGFIRRSHYTDIGSFPYHQVVARPELFDRYYLNFFGVSYFPIMMCGNLFRKSAIDKAMHNTRLCCKEIPFVGEDHYAFMKLFPFVNSMYRTNETTYYYRCGGSSSDRFSPTYPSLFFLSDERLKLLDQYQLKDGYRPLFEEYANTVFYHAQQLLMYKKADKEGVIAFLKEELSKRVVVQRMREFFIENRTQNNRLLLILNSDYEGIYNSVEQSIKNLGFKYRCKKLILRLMDLWS